MIGDYLTLTHLAHYAIGAGFTALALWLYLKFMGDSVTPVTFALLVIGWPISWCFCWNLRNLASQTPTPPMRDPHKRPR